MKKNKKNKTIRFFTIALSMLSFLPMTEALAAEVRMADHGSFTRIVFDFPKLTAYTVAVGNNNVNVELGIAEKIKLPVKPTSVVNGVSQIIKDGSLEINLKTKGKVSLKDYRLQRKIILDISEDTSVAKISEPVKELKKIKEVKKQPEPVKAVKNANLEMQQTEPKAAEVKQPEQKNLGTQPVNETHKDEAIKKTDAKEVKADIKPEQEIVAAKSLEEVQSRLAEYTAVKVDSNIPPAKKVEKAPEEIMPEPSFLKKPGSGKTNPKLQAMYQEAPTKIAISSLKTSKLAVFQRADILWIVTDDAQKPSLPLIDGPLKNFIQAPQILRSADAIAYAYTLPKTLYPVAKKHGMVWEVSLYDNNYIDKEPVTFSPSFDKNGFCEKVAIPIEGAGKVITFNDPLIGDTLYIIPTDKDTSIITNTNLNADFKTIPTALGMIIKPLKDNLRVYSIKDLVFVTSTLGINLVSQDFPVLISADVEQKGININDINDQRVFNFPDWIKGGSEKMRENKLAIQDNLLKATSPEEKTQLAMEMATLYLANGFGHEAAGILDLAQQTSPEIEKNPDFIAIRGAVEALAGRYEKALEYFSYPPIQQNPEIKMWTGLAAARTEQWKKAERLFPDNNVLLLQYPSAIAIPFTIYMAESNLRLGKTKAAQNLLDTVKMNDKAINAHHKAAVEYLRGEVARQKGEFATAIKLWEPVSKGIDRLYHTKASLALALLQLEQKDINLEEAINKVENLRFAWREDSLEVEVLSTLGSLKAKNLQPLIALEDYSKAITISKKINHDMAYLIESMQKIFYDLFVNGAYPTTPTFDVISSYTKFNYLFPKEGETYALIALKLTDYLIKADLLEKAAEKVQYLLDENLLSEKTIPEAGAKLSAIYLMDAKPHKALRAIILTEPKVPTTIDPKLEEERILLKAKSYSKIGNVPIAVALLDRIKSKNTILLKADIFWRAKQWKDAAETLQTLIPARAKDVNDENANYVLNTAIAWKLAENSAQLKVIKDTYGAALQNTAVANVFKVITREENGNNLVDRETTLKIAEEAEIFKDFLSSYKELKN